MPTYTPIQSIELTSTATEVLFSNIPQTYEDLILVAYSIASSTAFDTWVQFNGDTASNYSFTSMNGTGSAAQSFRASSQTSMAVDRQATVRNVTYVVHQFNIMNYSNTSMFKACISKNAAPNDSTELLVGVWRSNSAINSIKFSNNATANFAAGSRFDLYGVSSSAANTTKAFGGTEIYYDSTYAYHVFKGSGIFTPNTTLTCDYMVIAGGGGSGSADGGGGGAGGFRLLTSQSISTAQNIIVGGGGTGGLGYGKIGTNGGNSSFGSTSATGGGAGGVEIPTPAGDVPGSGGSGGGASVFKTNQGSGNAGGYSPVEGYAGGPGSGTPGSPNYPNNSSFVPNYGAGGGGGAGAAGTIGLATGGGTGGIGAGGTSYTNYTIINQIGLATSTGQLSGGNYYYAGGGGGGGYSAASNTGTDGAGGLGGGGTGKMYSQGVGGTMNTGGGGGGGGSNSTTNFNGSNGGSGIVIVRYPR